MYNIDVNKEIYLYKRKNGTGDTNTKKKCVTYKLSK